MRHTIVLTVALLALLPTVVTGQSRRVVEMGITAPEMAQYFQANAGASDIARVDHPNDIGLISGITVGRKMAIFKSAAQIQQFLASNPGALDIVGYNLEAGQTHDAAELANPVAAAKNVRAIASQYGKQVAIGLTRDLTLRYGAAMAPYADIWVLQIQKAQNDPALAAGFVNQMVPALRKANQSIEIFVQIRTDSSPAALASLVNGLSGVHVSILTQRSDVREAVAVASVFFGGKAQAQTVNFQPVAMPGGSQYGIRIPSKIAGCYAPVASNLIGSDEDHHTNRGSPTLAWDWSASVGSPVFPMCPGVVRRASSANEGGYGWNIVIDHSNGLSTLYAHCKENSFRVKPGQQVDVWTPICVVGRTGMTSWPHVHLNIDVSGKHTRVGQYFDNSLVRICHFTKCQATNDPAAPIHTGNGTVATSQQQAPVQAATRLDRLYGLMQGLQPDVVARVVVAIFVVLCLLWWLGGIYERVFAISLGTSMVVAACALWIVMPINGQPTQTVQQPTQTTQVGTEAFETALKVTLKREGTGCDTYIVRTLNGVTQWTYDRYRKAKGLPKADVCSSLTEAEWRYIYYNYYWLPSGANELPINAAIPVFDHYVNAGRKIASCGTDVKCVNQQRLKFYLGTSDCARKTQVCRAWLDRVEYIRQLTEGK